MEGPEKLCVIEGYVGVVGRHIRMIWGLICGLVRSRRLFMERHSMIAQSCENNLRELDLAVPCIPPYNQDDEWSVY